MCGGDAPDRKEPVPAPKKTFWDYLPEDEPLTEESVWQAIADAEGLDYSEIADGDLVDWL